MSDSLFDLSGKVALVTGTSRGLWPVFCARTGQGRCRSCHHQPSKNSLTAVCQSRLALLAAKPSARNSMCASTRAYRARNCRRRRPLRQDRYSGQQCRLQCSQAGAGNYLGRLEPSARYKFARHIFCRAGRCARHDSAPLRAHHQHRFGDRVSGFAGPGALRCQPRRRQAIDHESGRRLGRPRNHRQLSCARLVQNRAKCRAV